MTNLAGLAPPPHQTPDQQHFFAQLIARIKMVVRDQLGVDHSGRYLGLWKALDATDDASGAPVIIPRAPYAIGNISGSTAIDLDDSGTQTATLTADATITGISNFTSGAWMNLRFDNSGGYTLTFSGTAFEGPVLAFTDTTIWCSVVDFGQSKLAVLGGGVS